jgi:hypothetical protein
VSIVSTLIQHSLGILREIREEEEIEKRNTNLKGSSEIIPVYS